MFWMFLVLLVMGFVFFKLGVYSIVLALFQLLFKVLFVLSGAFLLVAAWRWVARRRRTQPVAWGR